MSPRQVSQKKVETPATSSSVPSTGASKAQGTRSDDVPAPMETGRVGDGRSWADQVEASADDEFQRHRPAKRRQSQSRRREDDQHFPSHSRIMRGDVHQQSRSTSMQESNHGPATMWPPWE